ncbi:9754_t:CDS:2, partial [Ambispora leptoticha]
STATGQNRKIKKARTSNTKENNTNYDPKGHNKAVKLVETITDNKGKGKETSTLEESNVQNTTIVDACQDLPKQMEHVGTHDQINKHASVEARNLQKAFKLARIQEKKHLSQRKEEGPSDLSPNNPYIKKEKPLALSPNNPYIKEEIHEMIVETGITESSIMDTESDADTKMEPVIFEAEITITSSSADQISEVSQTENMVITSQESMIIDPLSTLYDQTKVLENTTQTEESDGFTVVTSKKKARNRNKINAADGNKIQSGSGLASKAYKPY